MGENCFKADLFQRIFVKLLFTELSKQYLNVNTAAYINSGQS